MPIQVSVPNRALRTPDRPVFGLTVKQFILLHTVGLPAIAIWRYLEPFQLPFWQHAAVPFLLGIIALVMILEFQGYPLLHWAWRLALHKVTPSYYVYHPRRARSEQ
jgi:hypothetical protein